MVCNAGVGQVVTGIRQTVEQADVHRHELTLRGGADHRGCLIPEGIGDATAVGRRAVDHDVAAELQTSALRRATGRDHTRGAGCRRAGDAADAASRAGGADHQLGHGRHADVVGQHVDKGRHVHRDRYRVRLERSRSRRRTQVHGLRRVNATHAGTYRHEGRRYLHVGEGHGADRVLRGRKHLQLEVLGDAQCRGGGQAVAVQRQAGVGAGCAGCRLAHRGRRGQEGAGIGGHRQHLGGGVVVGRGDAQFIDQRHVHHRGGHVRRGAHAGIGVGRAGLACHRRLDHAVEEVELRRGHLADGHRGGVRHRGPQHGHFGGRIDRISRVALVQAQADQGHGAIDFLHRIGPGADLEAIGRAIGVGIHRTIGGAFDVGAAGNRSGIDAADDVDVIDRPHRLLRRAVARGNAGAGDHEVVGLGHGADFRRDGKGRHRGAIVEGVGHTAAGDRAGVARGEVLLAVSADGERRGDTARGGCAHGKRAGRTLQGAIEVRADADVFGDEQPAADGEVDDLGRAVRRIDGEGARAGHAGLRLRRLHAPARKDDLLAGLSCRGVERSLHTRQHLERRGHAGGGRGHGHHRGGEVVEVLLRPVGRHHFRQHRHFGRGDEADAGHQVGLRGGYAQLNGQAVGVLVPGWVAGGRIDRTGALQHGQRRLRQRHRRDAGCDDLSKCCTHG